MKRKIEFKDGRRTIRVELSPEEMYEYDILGEVKDVITDIEARNNNFFHVTAKDDEIILELQGYNTPSFETLIFDVSKLNEEEKQNAIVCLYRAVQWRSKLRVGDEHLMYIEHRKGKGIREGIRFEDEMRSKEPRKH